MNDFQLGGRRNEVGSAGQRYKGQRGTSHKDAREMKMFKERHETMQCRNEGWGRQRNS